MFYHLGFQSHSDASVTRDRLLFVNPRPFDGFRLNYIHTKSGDFESNCARYNSISTTKIHLRGSRSLFCKYHDPFFMENLLKKKQRIESEKHTYVYESLTAKVSIEKVHVTQYKTLLWKRWFQIFSIMVQVPQKFLCSSSAVFYWQENNNWFFLCFTREFDSEWCITKYEHYLRVWFWMIDAEVWAVVGSLILSDMYRILSSSAVE